MTTLSYLKAKGYTVVMNREPHVTDGVHTTTITRDAPFFIWNNRFDPTLEDIILYNNDQPKGRLKVIIAGLLDEEETPFIFLDEAEYAKLHGLYIHQEDLYRQMTHLQTRVLAAKAASAAAIKQAVHICQASEVMPSQCLEDSMWVDGHLIPIKQGVRNGN